jgi:hypothetical protein
LLQLEQRCVIDARFMSRYDREPAHLAGLVGPSAAVQRDDPQPGDLSATTGVYEPDSGCLIP